MRGMQQKDKEPLMLLKFRLIAIRGQQTPASKGNADQSRFHAPGERPCQHTLDVRAILHSICSNHIQMKIVFHKAEASESQV